MMTGMCLCCVQIFSRWCWLLSPNTQFRGLCFGRVQSVTQTPCRCSYRRRDHPPLHRRRKPSCQTFCLKNLLCLCHPNCEATVPLYCGCTWAPLFLFCYCSCFRSRGMDFLFLSRSYLKWFISSDQLSSINYSNQFPSFATWLLEVDISHPSYRGEASKRSRQFGLD